VTRLFVNPAIKKALCRDAGEDRAWLGKVQPWLGQDWHFHVCVGCPADSPGHEPQLPRDAGADDTARRSSVRPVSCSRSTGVALEVQDVRSAGRMSGC
jgi:murein endopeptidase